MKLVGETNFSRMGKAKWVDGSLSKKNIKVTCGCGKVSYRSAAGIKKYPINKTHCFTCQVKKRKEDKNEINKALIAIARRKGLIK